MHSTAIHSETAYYHLVGQTGNNSLMIITWYSGLFVLINLKLLFINIPFFYDPI